MSDSPHFVSFDTWEASEEFMGFPLLGRALDIESMAFRAHVRDHRMRKVAPTLEIHFGEFVLSQARIRDREARRDLFERRYGSSRTEGLLAGHEAAWYELGPEPEPDDVDPRPPSVVTWIDGDVFLLMASGHLLVQRLCEIADALYH